MDKKRRNIESSKTTNSNNQKKCTLLTVTELINTQEHCGILTKKFQFLPEYGDGYIEYIHFDGLHIAIFDVSLNKDFDIHGTYAINALELSYLIDGEQIIKINEKNYDLIYESQESYLVYISQTSGSIKYHKNKYFKEIKIRMSLDFIKKHKLDSAYGIREKYELEKQDKEFTKPLCTKTQEILAELLTDTRQGLLKRLFLESKVLELLSLQLDIQKNSKTEILNTDNHLIKKLYEVQFIINSDLTIQYSVHELTRMVGLNDFILKKEFKRVFGTTIFEYALNLRMSKAKKLLQHGKKPIYEISELVGYKNSTHFTAAFKKLEGITPKKYRQRGLETIR
ncbi:AraC-like DNA-binding protein [Aquimarina sp. EL_43]|uniref:AraC family transcriptional regulator n=1 Tax=Aquimarina TaxID=290174 RepID=UPI0004BCDD9B|nr:MULTISPECIES: AraC family transcriptional regulator [Aquimarina]MBG6130202.1 AraC-like DNA-binding protein [Aquimarina sp. EL_35]MBG6148982.1 AraC-like DNA-binding protein [Aquimarina sp. EL_32]MBG6168644.1 AraC-like DNA-binding protein [Aquimarina sp. EL_43]